MTRVIKWRRKPGRPKEPEKYPVIGRLSPVVGGLFERVYMHYKIESKNQLVKLCIFETLPEIANELGIDLTDDEKQELGLPLTD